MGTFRTNSKISGQPEITFSVDEEGEIDPQWLLSFFENAVQQQGRRFVKGQTVQIGWMILLLKENQHNELELWEPDFDSFPISWIPSVNNTFRHLILQKSIAELFQCDPEFPPLNHAGLVAAEFVKVSQTYVMTREEPSG